MQLVLDHLSVTRRYLIGVSGGRDSAALLHALHAQGFAKLVVCHLNHRLRGRASGGDAVFVKRLAGRLGYTLESSTVDVARLALQTGQSIETAARQARHEFFADVARRYRCPRVILAHHADDQAETVLMRILRGTGISGLAGMKIESRITVGRTELELFRPMLAARRSEVDAYIAKLRLQYREDATNSDPKPVRNLLRQSLLPHLNTAIGRDVTPMLNRLAESAERDDALLHQLTLALIHDALLFHEDGSLVLRPELRQAAPALQHRVVHHWLKKCQIPGIDHDLISAAVRLMIEPDPARLNLPRGLQLRRKAGHLRISNQAGSKPG